MSSISLPTSEVPSRDSVLRAQLDERACWEKVADTIVSIWREVVFFLGLLFGAICSCGAEEPAAAMEITQRPDSCGLVVLVHGLRSSPKIWASQVALLERESVDIFVPHVPERGLCSLEEAVAPIYPVISEYARQNPQKPIVLLGHSNGSRIVSWIEVHLREEAPQSAVRVSAIAGVIFGSSRMDLIDGCCLTSCCYPQPLGDELKYGSETAQALLESLAAPLPAGCASRTYEFFATPEDCSVPDLDSSFPLLNKGEQYHLMPGHSHNSIVAAVAERQMRACLEWMNE